MPTISGSTSIGAGVTTNLLVGQQYEFMPFDGTVEIGVQAAAAGLTCSVFAGSDILQQPGGIVPSGGAGSMPKYPDDYHWEDTCLDGDRLAVNVTNPTGGAIVLNWVVRLSEG